jgi:hypothetical protein
VRLHGKITKSKVTRLGGLIAFVCGRLPYDHILNDLLRNELLEPDGDWFALTDKGYQEMVKLTNMAGLHLDDFSPE